MNIIGSDVVIFLLLVFFLGTSMCVDNMSLCEKDKQHGEEQQDSMLFSDIAAQIRLIRIWTTAGCGRLCFFNTLRVTEHLLGQHRAAEWENAGNIGMSHLAEASESAGEILLGRTLSGNQGGWMYSWL